MLEVELKLAIILTVFVSRFVFEINFFEKFGEFRDLVFSSFFFYFISPHVLLCTSLFNTSISFPLKIFSLFLESLKLLFCI